MDHAPVIVGTRVSKYYWWRGIRIFYFEITKNVQFFMRKFQKKEALCIFLILLLVRIFSQMGSCLKLLILTDVDGSTLVLTTLTIYCTFTYDNNFLLRM
jgi:hypothetical protein